MTCEPTSGEIEVFKMRGRRAAFIYPACSESRILLLHSSRSFCLPFIFILAVSLHPPPERGVHLPPVPPTALRPVLSVLAAFGSPPLPALFFPSFSGLSSVIDANVVSSASSLSFECELCREDYFRSTPLCTSNSGYSRGKESVNIGV